MGSVQAADGDGWRRAGAGRVSICPIATSSKVYQAPLQLTANGGVLIIDDFGRQKCSPVAMLNRWITPLESRIDFLTLQTGQKLVVPFAVLVVFATNIRPSELLDEAFLRRIRYKVFAESPTLDDFKEIFRRAAATTAVSTFEESLVDGLVRRRVRAARHPACAARIRAI